MAAGSPQIRRRLQSALGLVILVLCAGCGQFFENRPRAEHPTPPLGEGASSPDTRFVTNSGEQSSPTTVATQSPVQHSQPPAPALPAPPPAQQPKPAAIRRPKINLDAERRNLLEADAVFSRASEEQGAAEAFYDYLTPDALLLLPGEVPIKGPDAIKVHFTVNRPGLFIWRARDAKVAENGDFGYTWGTYEVRSYNLDTRNPPIRYGKYLMVWKKQPDGLWKASVISDSPSPPPTERR